MLVNTLFRKLALFAGMLGVSCAAVGVPRSVAPIPFDGGAVGYDGNRYFLSWHGDGLSQVRIWAGADPEHTDRLIGTAAGSGQLTVADPDAAPRWYFRLEPDHGTPLVIADRVLHLTSAANFRDAGGYRTATGNWVRMGLVYRSNGLEHLSDHELDQIAPLKIRLVCDLRTDEERARGADRLPAGAEALPADVLADDAELIHALLAPGGNLPQRSPQEIEEQIYRDFVRLPSARAAYHRLFTRLADASQLPTVFHCTAGKDRTGWAAAVFLTLLGVPHSVVVQDYLLTNAYSKGAVPDGMPSPATRSAMSYLVGAHRAGLDAAFDQVTRDYGSFPQYLSHGLKLDAATLAALKRNFLVLPEN